MGNMTTKEFNRLMAARAVAKLPSRPKKLPRPTVASAISELARHWLDAWTLLGHPAPTPEHRFEPERKWRFDFAWVESRVAVEIHGGVWSRGRHTRGAGFIGDREKVARAQELGWLVYEVTNVKDTRLMDRIAGRIRVRAGGGR